MASDALDVISFLLGIVGLIVSLKLHRVIARRFPRGRLKQIEEALTEARMHVERLLGGGHIVQEKAADMLSNLAKLERRRDELWLEVYRWEYIGFERLVHPTLGQLLRSCAEVFKRISDIREQLCQTSELPVNRRVDAWRRRFLPSPFTNEAVTVSSSQTGRRPEASSTLSNLPPQVNPPPGNPIELDMLARPCAAHQPHRMRTAQTSLATPTGTTLPEISPPTTVSVPTKPIESIRISPIASPPLVATSALNHYAQAGKGKGRESREGDPPPSESAAGDAAANGRQTHASGVDASLAHDSVAGATHASDLHPQPGPSTVLASPMRSSLGLPDPSLATVVTCDVPRAHASGVEAISTDGAITACVRNMVHRDHNRSSRAGADSVDSPDPDEMRNEHDEEARHRSLTSETLVKPRSKMSQWVAKCFSYNKTRGSDGEVFRKLAVGVPGIFSMDMSMLYRGKDRTA